MFISIDKYICRLSKFLINISEKTHAEGINENISTGNVFNEEGVL